MRREVTDILRRTARKLLIARAAEASAVLATAAGLAAAALESAWALARSQPIASALICALPVAIGLCVLLCPAATGAIRVERRIAVLLAGFCAIAGAAGAAGVIAGWHRHLPGWALPLILLPAGAIVGAGAMVARGVSLRDAAIYLDVRCRLGERLSTAAELASSDRADDPLAMCVYSQALTALRKHPPGAVAMWRRTRATAAALGLAVLLAATLAFLPGGEAGARDSVAVRLAESLDKFTPRQRKELSEAFLGAARAVENDPGLAGKLAEAAKVIEVKDARKLQEIVEALQKAGFQPLKVVPEDLRAVAGLVGGAQDGGSTSVASTGGEGGNGGGPSTRLVSADANDQAGGAYVSVYDPQYAKVLAGRPPAGQIDKVTPGADIPYEDAWSAARRAAAANLAGGKTPVRYRQIVRDFFLVQE